MWLIAKADYLEAQYGPLHTVLRTKLYASFENSMASFKKRDKVSYEDISVVKDLISPLVGHPAIESLNLVTWVESITSTDNQMTKDVVLQLFPSLFGKLGKLQGSYHIKLKEPAVPLSLNIPRPVAIPLLPKVQKN